MQFPLQPAVLRLELFERPGQNRMRESFFKAARYRAEAVLDGRLRLTYSPRPVEPGKPVTDFPLYWSKTIL